MKSLVNLNMHVTITIRVVGKTKSAVWSVGYSQVAKYQ